MGNFYLKKIDGKNVRVLSGKIGKIKFDIAFFNSGFKFFQVYKKNKGAFFLVLERGGMMPPYFLSNRWKLTHRWKRFRAGTTSKPLVMDMLWRGSLGMDRAGRPIRGQSRPVLPSYGKLRRGNDQRVPRWEAMP